MELTIVSPEKILFKGEAQAITVPGTMGKFEVLDNHASIVSSLKEDKLTYKVSGKETTLNISGGFIEVSNNKVSVCVEV